MKGASRLTTASCHRVTGLAFCIAPVLGVMGSCDCCDFCFGFVFCVCFCGTGFVCAGFFTSGFFSVGGASVAFVEGGSVPSGSFGRSGMGAVSTGCVGAAKEGLTGADGGTMGGEGGTMEGCCKGCS